MYSECKHYCTVCFERFPKRCRKKGVDLTGSASEHQCTVALSVIQTDV